MHKRGGHLRYFVAISLFRFYFLTLQPAWPHINYLVSL
jgi:hypothetical protein